MEIMTLWVFWAPKRFMNGQERKKGVTKTLWATDATPDPTHLGIRMRTSFIHESGTLSQLVSIFCPHSFPVLLPIFLHQRIIAFSVLQYRLPIKKKSSLMNIISPSHVGNLVLFPPTEERKANRELKEPLFLFFSFLGGGEGRLLLFAPTEEKEEEGSRRIEKRPC